MLSKQRRSSVSMVRVFSVLSILFCPSYIFAASKDIHSLAATMDILWIVIAAILVFFMQTGFALLESGLSRAKNAINVIMKNYVDICVGSLAFWFIGFGIMFGDNPSGWFGVTHFMVNDVSAKTFALLFFQTMFAATAVTIASGAMAERTHYNGYLVGAIFTTALIYPIFGSWAWGSLFTGKGWLAQMGFIDFAGSTVVHSIGGWVALAGIIVLGPRIGRFSSDGEIRSIPGHNLTYVAMGGFILWLGWFGFNAGSTAQANDSIGQIALNTHMSAVAGAVSTLLGLIITRRALSVSTIVNGSIGGLVAITAGCASMSPFFAIVTGFVAGFVVVLGQQILEAFRLDDVVGAVPTHGFCGAWGTLAVGMFKTGDLFSVTQITIQVVGIIAAFLWAFPAALIMYMIIHRAIGLRASTVHEQRGLDFSEHSEMGYPEFQTQILHKGRH